jgi:hypothetical protein
VVAQVALGGESTARLSASHAALCVCTVVQGRIPERWLPPLQGEGWGGDGFEEVFVEHARCLLNTAELREGLHTAQPLSPTSRLKGEEGPQVHINLSNVIGKSRTLFPHAL